MPSVIDPVALQEMSGDEVVNGLTISALPVSIDAIIRANLKLHRAVFARMTPHSVSHNRRRKRVQRPSWWGSNSVSAADYLNFLNQHLSAIAASVAV